MLFYYFKFLLYSVKGANKALPIFKIKVNSCHDLTYLKIVFSNIEHSNKLMNKTLELLKISI